jgi:hypothetical protein
MKKLLLVCLLAIISNFSYGLPGGCVTAGQPWCDDATLPPTNDNIGSAILITGCNINFNATNDCATNGGAGTEGGDFAGCFGWNNVDGNASTDCYGSGADVPWSVENDIWYRFCPGTTGTWTVNITATNCTSTSGYQVAFFPGTSTNLGGCPLDSENSVMSSSTALTISSTTSCVYINIDGYGGTVCDFAVSISTTSCVLLANKLIYLDGKRAGAFNQLNWSGSDESTTKEYHVYRSSDLSNWSLVSVSSTSTAKKYQYNDAVNSGLYYYKVSSIDFRGQEEESQTIAIFGKKQEIKSVRVFDVYGKEYSESNLPSGIIVYMTEFEDGSIETRKEYRSNVE